MERDAALLVDALRTHLQARDALPSGLRQWWGRQLGHASKLLAERPLEAWLRALRWAQADAWWSSRLTSLSQLGTKVWPQFALAEQRARQADEAAAKWGSFYAEEAPEEERDPEEG